MIRIATSAHAPVLSCFAKVAASPSPGWPNDCPRPTLTQGTHPARVQLEWSRCAPARGAVQKCGWRPSQAPGQLRIRAHCPLDAAPCCLAAHIIFFLFLREGPRSQGASCVGGLRFRSTAIRFFKFVWCFRLQVFREFFLRNGSN